MSTVADLINRLGGTAEVARKLGLGASTVSEWKRTGSIPAGYWLAITQIQPIDGSEPVTPDWLMQAHAKPLPAAAPQSAGADA